jgi:hypothetical protein
LGGAPSGVSVRSSAPGLMRRLIRRPRDRPSAPDPKVAGHDLKRGVTSQRERGSKRPCSLLHVVVIREVPPG